MLHMNYSGRKGYPVIVVETNHREFKISNLDRDGRIPEVYLQRAPMAVCN